MTPSDVDCPISVLVVDDEEILARSCTQILAGEYEVRLETRGREALESVRRNPPDIVLADLMLPDMDGIDLLREIRRFSPETLVIMITGFATVTSSIEAIQAGAYDYIPKPFTATQLRILLGRASQRVLLSRDNAHLRDQLRRQGWSSGIVGSSAPMRKILSIVDRVGPTDASVFISGESGTGKELVARALHARSPRSAKAFVAINCAAVPDQLLESELFGHEKGAFTGANGQRRGLLEEATGGTFLLDEITEMSLDLQAKLLRVIQERKIRRVGGAREIPIDVRWVAATNRDPEQAIREGQLRHDLYFRLNVVPIELPPLRVRPDDIPALAQVFLDRYAREYGRPGIRLSPAVQRALREYAWPGNVRELQNVIERMVSLSTEGEIGLEDLPDSVHRGRNGDVLEPLAGLGGLSTEPVPVDMPFHVAKARAIAAFEKAYLRDLLTRHGGNISSAAREARVDRKTIHRMLSRHDLNGVHPSGGDRTARKQGDLAAGGPESQ